MENGSEESRTNRRTFLLQVSATTTVAGAALSATARGKQESPVTPLPTIQLGSHSITRLVAGWNPIGGYSYLGPNMDQHMREYFSEDRTVEFLQRCERNGITAHQFDPSEMMVKVLRRVREAGSGMKFICLHSADSGHGTVEQVAETTDPIAFAHHGGVTDRLFREGKAQQVRDYVKRAHDLGFLAGVSAHNPENIKRIADEDWENDFFMTCFHYLTRLNDHPELEADVKTIGKAFYKSDPEEMSRVVRQVGKPCLAFKILAAGRSGFSRNGVSEAFEYAFQNIKPIDAVIVGMYPRFKDEIGENAELTRRFGQTDVLS